MLEFTLKSVSDMGLANNAQYGQLCLHPFFVSSTIVLESIHSSIFSNILKNVGEKISWQSY